MANIYQKGLSFSSVEDLLEHLPDDQQAIVEVLRKLILEALPQCTEKINYNVPFYAIHKNICFIWPSYIPWGGISEGVALGFTRGAHLSDQTKVKAGSRKMVRTMLFHETSEINHNIIRSLLYEAELLDAAL